MLPIFMSGRVAAPLVLGLFSVLPALPLACQGTATGIIDVDTPWLKAQGRANGSWPNKTLDLSTEPAFDCVEIQFTDPSGNPVGEPWTGGLPATGIPIPQGATDFNAKECDEDEEERMLAGPRGKLRRIDEWFFMGGPVDPKLLAGELSYAITISATSRARAEDQLQELLTEARQGTAGLEALPGGVYRIHYLSRTKLVDLALVFEFFDDASFQQLDFTLNDVPETRTLEDAVLFQAGGWHAAVLTVPVTEFEAGATIGVTYHNDYVFHIRSGGGDPCTVSGFWDYTLH